MIYLISNQSNLYSNEFINISVEESIDILDSFEIFGLDTETKGLDVFTKEVLLLQIGDFNNQVLYDIASFGGKIPEPVVVFLNNTMKVVILQNAKFDCKFLFHQNIILKNIYDTMLAEIILTHGLQYKGRDLVTIVEKYCGVTLSKEVRGRIIKFGLSSEVLFYGAKDVKYLVPVREAQLKIAETLHLVKAVELDNAFVPALAYVEYCGIKLDYQKWSEKTKSNIAKVFELKQALEAQLWRDGMHKFFSGMTDLFTGEQECILNWDSPKQVISLFKDYGIKVEMRIKGEIKETIDAKVLEPQVNQFTILRPYLNYKEAQKEVSTYGFNWKNYINPITGRIHTTFQQIMDTGRLSSGNKDDNAPNLQNLPGDKITRSCFIPENHNLMIDADFHAQEQVVLANFAKEPNLINFYQKGFSDMHSYVAFLMYPNIRRCTVEELTPDKLTYIKEEYSHQRYLAKIAGFSINYGGNGSTIAKNCNIPKADGEYVYKSYFESFPYLRQYFDQCFKKASFYGYIEFNPITGRKYFFNKEENNYFKYKDEVEDRHFWQLSSNPREIQSKYNKSKGEIARLSQNYPIQGTSADITKLATIYFYRKIISNNWFNTVKIVNLIHDEILVECPENMVDEVQTLLVTCMETAGKPFCQTVPLTAEAINGKHWVH